MIYLTVSKYMNDWADSVPQTMPTNPLQTLVYNGSVRCLIVSALCNHEC